jgi:hypothetical protein
MRRRAEERAFGIYRPLSEESCERIQDALESAKTSLDEHFGSSCSKYTELIIPNYHGVTFVKRDNVLKALKTSAMKNFSIHRAHINIANYNRRREETPTVPIDGLDWFGHGKLKLVGKFALATVEAQELAEESQQIDMFLEDAGAQGLCVYEPDHVTLCRFRRSNKGHSLDDQQKREVQAIVRNELVAAQIGEVTLEDVVIGNGYRQPISLQPSIALA